MITAMPRPCSTQILFLTDKTPGDVRTLLAGFSQRYVTDWDLWSTAAAAGGQRKVITLREILRRWQATRVHVKGRIMRRPKWQARHEPPYLDDLVGLAEVQLAGLGQLSVRDLADASDAAVLPLIGLWDIFVHLTTLDDASCVGISKAVMLLSDGRFGPALDRIAKKNLHIRAAPAMARDWIGCLRCVSEDIRAFEARHRLVLESLLPVPSPNVGGGHIYDMLVGPRERN